MFSARQRLIILFFALLLGFGLGYARVKLSPVVMQDMPSRAESPLAGVDLGGPFSLTDQDGTAVTEASWPGQYRLVFFGFTHCPDVCPTGLGKMAEALDALPAETLVQIQPLFITLDPARDTAPQLKEYVKLFHPRLVGLTGTQDQIDAVIKAYRVYAQKQVIDGDTKNYMVNHSSFTYLVAPDGKVIDVYTHDTSGADMAAKIKQQIKQ